MSLGAWGDGGADACGEAVAALHVVAQPHPVHGGNFPGRAGLSGPLARFGGRGVLGHQPNPGLGHLGAGVVARTLGVSVEDASPASPADPRRGGAFDWRCVVVSQANRWIAVAQ